MVIDQGIWLVVQDLSVRKICLGREANKNKKRK
jgi:hypothetical protein